MKIYFQRKCHKKRRRFKSYLVILEQAKRSDRIFSARLYKVIHHRRGEACFSHFPHAKRTAFSSPSFSNPTLSFRSDAREQDLTLSRYEPYEHGICLLPALCKGGWRNLLRRGDCLSNPVLVILERRAARPCYAGEQALITSVRGEMSSRISARANGDRRQRFLLALSEKRSARARLCLALLRALRV